MTNTITHRNDTAADAVAAHLSEITAHVRVGNLRAAKAHMRRILDRAHPRVLNLITQCVEIRQNYPRIAAVKLRHLAQTSDPADRAIIEQCTPAHDQASRHVVPTPETRATRQAIQYRAPRNSHTRTEDAARHAPRHPAEARQLKTADTRTENYVRQRGGVDDQPTRSEPLDGYTIDYDKAASHPLRGTCCVFCWCERAARDHCATGSDDGLCSECRERDRPGLPALPDEHSRADAIRHRCHHWATNYRPATARAMIRRDWHAVGRADRAVMAAWIKSNRALLNTDTAPATGNPQATQAAA
ncbi:hypothetical protein [Labedaea rhizosphaerae]|uniref:Uncharacterized protein n=1 Tax=Labedaea rhizosphaerae TaxID=598644 RepID=A0A4V3CZQ6_LABRH|nr:hypothetical protein [Labedaea rhizosphaerae]TDQ00611.1 hypothetical protein EV186_102472 [Labedaea rhizosphaerae]